VGRGFSSTGQTSGMSRIERMLQNHKGSNVTMGVGVPIEREGGVGDITVRTVADGVRCYIKTNSGWKDVNTMVPATQLVWHEMVLDDTWVIYSASYYAPAYTRDANGFVHFRGVIKDGSPANATITTLPSGFRPSKNQLVTGNASTSGGAGVQIQITTVGVVNAAFSGDVTLTSLDGVSFYAGEIVIGTSTGGGGGSGSKGGASGGGGGGGAG
jgi:hypothetical protein